MFNRKFAFATSVAFAAAMALAPATAMAASDGTQVSLDKAPQVSMSNATFSANTKAAGSASLVGTNKQQVWLNMQETPMTAKQIVGKCISVKVGTVFYNQVRGNKYVKTKVKKGDNVFCMGKDKKWRKKSCNNIALGLFKQPAPAKKYIVTGVIQNRYVYKGYINLSVKASGSANANVVQYMDGKKVCEASGTTSGVATASAKVWVNVSGFSRAQVEARALQAAKVNFMADSKVKSELNAALTAAVKGNASASCSVTRPDTPPPVVVTPPPVVVVVPPPTTPVTPPTTTTTPPPTTTVKPKDPAQDATPPSNWTPAPAPSTPADTAPPA